MRTPCYHCEKRTTRCHATCEEYKASIKKYQEEKEIKKRNCDTLRIKEQYYLDKADKIQKYMRNRRRK